MKSSSTAAALLAVLAVAACGGDDGDGTGVVVELNAQQRTAVAGAIGEAAIGVIASAIAQSSGPAATSGAVPITIPLTGSRPCAITGEVRVIGTISGDLDSSNSGTVNLNATQSVVACRVPAGSNQLVLNGKPTLAMTGSFLLTNGRPRAQETVRVNGTVTWQMQPGVSSGECAVDLTLTINTTSGAGTGTGTVCSQTVTI